MTLVSSVTEASSDMTLPHPIVAPVLTTSPASERIVPRNEVVVPRIAPVGASQVMLPVNGLPAVPPLITSTIEPLPVRSEVLMMITHVALLWPWASRVSTPPADKSNVVEEATVYTPGVRVAPVRKPAASGVPGASPAISLYAVRASPKGNPTPEATPAEYNTPGGSTVPGAGADGGEDNPETAEVEIDPATLP